MNYYQCVNNVLQNAYFNQEVGKTTEEKPLSLNISNFSNNGPEQTTFVC